MFARAYSLKGKESFDKVKQRGKLYQSEDFGVCVLKRDDGEVSKFGLIVSTKISKIAVHRNRIMRAVKEGVRRGMFRTPKNYDMVFLAKKEITKKTVEEIMREVDLFFKNTNFSK